MPVLSVIIPVFNEERNVRPLYEQLKSSLDILKREYEIIFIDDGSADASFHVLKDICRQDGRVKAVRFGRNYGQTAALAAGFDRAQGDILITMDGDLQNDPRDIPALLDKMEEGHDIVSGWRRARKDPLLTKKLPSRTANWLISAITGVRLRDYGCTLKAYKKEAVKDINLYGQMHRFLPALASWNGVSLAEIPVRHHARKHGRTNYGLSRISTVVLDLITVKFLLSFSTKPIQLFGAWGFLSLFFSGLSGLAVIAMKALRQQDMTGNPLLYLTILLLVVGVQFIVLGLLGEILIRVYHGSQRRPIYSVKESAN